MAEKPETITLEASDFSYSDHQLVPEVVKNLHPNIIVGKGVDSDISVSSLFAAQTMRELGISEESIASSAVYIDPKNRLANLGTHYSNKIGRLRFRSDPELRAVEGDIVRLSSKVRGKARTADQMNRIAVHEWEHLAQADRKDKKLTQGHIAIYGLAMFGALAGGRLGKNSASKKLGAAVGGYLGYQLGYWLAPHERQARLRAGQVRGLEPQVVSKAIRRK